MQRPGRYSTPPGRASVSKTVAASSGTAQSGRGGGGTQMSRSITRGSCTPEPPTADQEAEIKDIQMIAGSRPIRLLDVHNSGANLSHHLPTPTAMTLITDRETE